MKIIVSQILMGIVTAIMVITIFAVNYPNKKKDNDIIFEVTVKENKIFEDKNSITIYITPNNNKLLIFDKEIEFTSLSALSNYLSKNHTILDYKYNNSNNLDLSNAENEFLSYLKQNLKP